MRDFRKYEVWNEGHEVTMLIYEVTNNFPKEEIYGLTSQIRRASSSIPTNISEGCGRESDLDFRRFLIIASGSAAELEYLIFLSGQLNYITKDNALNLTEKVVIIRKKLRRLIDILKK